MKNKCNGCGHLTVIFDDRDNVIKGCALANVLKEEEEFAGMDDVSFIDSSFSLCVNDKCDFFVEQTEEQKRKLAKWSDANVTGIIEKFKRIFK